MVEVSALRVVVSLSCLLYKGRLGLDLVLEVQGFVNYRGSVLDRLP